MKLPQALLTIPFLFTSSFVAATPLPEPDMPEITYPETRQGDVVETLFGHEIADPYRWLENDVRTDSEVADWVAAQNAVTETHLESLPGRDVFRERLTEHIDFEQFLLPQERGPPRADRPESVVGGWHDRPGGMGCLP
jgi:prolyl oligopeptidase